MDAYYMPDSWCRVHASQNAASTMIAHHQTAESNIKEKETPLGVITRASSPRLEQNYQGILPQMLAKG